MAGFAELFGMGGTGGMFGGGDAGGMFGDLLTPEMKQQMAFRGLMAAAGAFGQAAMPSRMPVPIGAALGQAGAAMADAQDKGLENALKLALTSGKLQELKSKIALQNQAGTPPPEMYVSTPSGAPQPLVPAPVAPGADTLGGATSSTGGAGGWGPLAKPAVEALSGSGLSPAAVQGIMANGLGEGGFNDPWKKAGGNENSFGHWQFNQRGELPGYLAWAQGKGDPKDTKLQAQYVAQRMEEEHPGFSKIDDPKLATDLVALKFEKYVGAKAGQRYGLLADAQKAMAGGMPEARQPIPAAPGQLTDEGVLPPVPNFSGAMAGNQGPAYAPPVAPSAGFAPPDTVIASGAVAPRGGKIGAIGEGANARLVYMDTGAPVAPAAAAPVQVAQNGPLTSLPGAPVGQPGVVPVQAPGTAQIPAALSQTPPAPQTPYGGINPAYVKWAQTQANLRTALGIPVPSHISEAAKLPLDYAAPGANPALQGQIAGARTGAERSTALPYDVYIKNLEAANALRNAFAEKGRRQDAQGNIIGIPGFTDTEEANAAAAERGKQIPSVPADMARKLYETQLSTAAASNQPITTSPGQIVNVNPNRVPLPQPPVPFGQPAPQAQALAPPPAASPVAPPQQAGGLVPPAPQLSPGGAITMQGIDPGEVERAKIVPQTYVAELVKTRLPAANAAARTLTFADTAREYLNKNVIVGWGSNLRLDAAKAAALFGMDPTQIVNTETMLAQQARGVAALLSTGAFGTGASITENDRQYAAKMAGADSNLDQESMKRILDLGERAAKWELTQYNTDVSRFDPEGKYQYLRVAPVAPPPMPAAPPPSGAAALPAGVPTGSRQVATTKDGKPVFDVPQPDGSVKRQVLE